jgi:DNA-binding GntR family transcriptional regulator
MRPGRRPERRLLVRHAEHMLEKPPVTAPLHNGAPGVDEAERQGFAQLYERLRRAVLTGEFVPGSVVSQVELARAYNVSRAPLREALRMLQMEGLVIAEPGRRSRIAAVSAADLEQLYALRITVEALAVRLTVPRLNGKDVARLRELLTEMDDLAHTRDFDSWEVPHRAFHRTLVAGSGERVVGTIEELSDHASRYRRSLLELPRAWQIVAGEHRGIVDAVEAGDADVAAGRLAAHLATTALTVCAALNPEHDPAGVREALRVARSTVDRR